MGNHISQRRGSVKGITRAYTPERRNNSNVGGICLYAKSTHLCKVLYWTDRDYNASINVPDRVTVRYSGRRANEPIGLCCEAGIKKQHKRTENLPE